jgi:superfamily II RNA helicase
MLLPLLTREDSRGKKRIDKKVRAYLSSKHPPLLAPPRKLPPFGAILKVLKKYQLLPAIFFLKSRADCDNALERCTENRQTDQNRQARLAQRIDNLVSQHPYVGKHRQLWHLEHLAVGAHHSGQLPVWKLVLETLMTEGLLDAVFATSTVAAGVNFPARTVVFLNSDRFNGREFLPLNPTEFHQMTGRAGRRGMDNIGFAVAIPGKFMDIRLEAKLISSPPSDVSSQIRINFSMVLNLLLSHTPDQIEDLLKKSFATYLLIQGRKKKTVTGPRADDHKFLWGNFLQHLNFLKETKYVAENNKLTETGIWASQLRVDQPLMIAEGLKRKIFPEFDPAILAAIIASFVDEQESDDKSVKNLVPGTLLASFQKVKKGLRSFTKHMIERGFAVRPLFLKPAATIYAWATGQPWEKVLAVSETAEGNLAMLILRTADNLRHIRSLTQVFPAAAKTSETAIELILRDPVVMDYDL